MATKLKRGEISPATKKIRAEIYRLLMTERTGVEIADMVGTKWGLSKGTVKQYCWAVLNDFKCTSREQLLARELQAHRRALLRISSVAQRAAYVNTPSRYVNRATSQPSARGTVA